jgi:hypothetical protein
MRGFTALSLGLLGLVATLDASARTSWRHHYYQVDITGTPAATDVAGTAYSFTPTTSDPSGGTLTYSIAGKPSWATFNTATGQLAGTPSTTNAGTYSSIVISVTDGRTSDSLPPFAITVSRPVVTNTPPTISGTPSSSVNVGSAYTFMPAASDADKNALTFSVQNLPGWATFSTSTGALTGTPSATYAGTYSNIVISVSDGKASTSLAAFSIAVKQPANTGVATINWTPPLSNTDGTQITNLAGYHIHYGTSQNALNQTVQVSGTGLSSYTVSNLTSGTWYFSVTAYTSSGSESGQSNIATKNVL